MKPEPISHTGSDYASFSSDPAAGTAPSSQPALQSSLQENSRRPSLTGRERPSHPPAISTQLLAELANTRIDTASFSPTQESMQAHMGRGFAAARQYIELEVAPELRNEGASLLPRSKLEQIYKHHDQVLWKKMEAHFEHAFSALEQLPEDKQENRTAWLDERSAHYQTKATEALDQTFADAGWPVGADTTKWEDQSPVLIRRSAKTAPLTLKQAHVYAGEHGTISMFSNDDDKRYAAKIAIDKKGNSGKGLLDIELEAFQKIYDGPGVHRNLMNVYGLCKLSMDGKVHRALLMDALAGPNGKVVFAGLRRARDNGDITQGQFWNAIRYAAGRLIDLAAHLEKAGVVHNDIKPDNIVFDGKGELIVGDFGLWSETGKAARGSTAMYSPQEAYGGAVDARSDVAAIGATIAEAVAGDELFLKKDGRATQLYPNGGLAQGVKERADLGATMPAHPAIADNKPFNVFIAALLTGDIADRPTPQQAMGLDFLKEDPKTTDEQRQQREIEARATFAKAIALAQPQA